MSELAEAAAVSIMMADFAATDGVGKLNLIGGGVHALSFDYQTGGTSPFAVSVEVRIPAKYYNEHFTLEVTLLDAAGDPFRAPGPAPGVEGPVLRVGNSTPVEPPKFGPHLAPPPIDVPSRTSLVLNMNNGLPLAAGQGYSWEVRIDGDTYPSWKYPFFVQAPAPGPVFG